MSTPDDPRNPPPSATADAPVAPQAAASRGATLVRRTVATLREAGQGDPGVAPAAAGAAEVDRALAGLTGGDPVARGAAALAGAREAGANVEALARGAVGGALDPARGADALLQAAQGALPANGVRAATEAAGTAASVARTASEGVQALSRDPGGALRGVLGGLADGAGLGGGGDSPLPRVGFTFASAAAPDGAWRVTHFAAREGVSEVYRATIDLAHDDATADPDGLLGRPATLTLTRGEQVRCVRGIVRRVEQRGVLGGHARVRVVLVPALWSLGLRVTSAVYQDATVPEILQRVLTRGLGPFRRTVRLALQRGAYPRREYCVQYQESDLAFARRLMAEEGIAFYFDHTGEAEVLVLVDANAAFPLLTTAPDGAYDVLGPEADHAAVESVRHLHATQRLAHTQVVVRDYDWTRPELDVTRRAAPPDGAHADREAFEYPGPLTLGEYGAQHAYGADDGRPQAELRRQRHAARANALHGEGNITALVPGHVVGVRGHGRAAQNRRYLVTRVEHEGDAPEELLHAAADHARGDERAERYHNAFRALASDVPFRPARTPARPRMPGPQTARVVGPASEEIHTDEHGRIKVQFHWDRDGRRDERSSCWVRVQQNWAGVGWGTWFVPRIGMEVVVDFLDGDPDRPLVTGCVYNGTHPPPFALPEHKTQSGLRTRSSPNSAGFNELRFEDAAGQEEVFLHAQRDLNEVVLHNHSTRVTANQTNHVGGSQSETVVGVQTMTVKANRLKTVEKNEFTAVHKNRTETVAGHETITIAGKRVEHVKESEGITVDGDRALVVHGDHAATVDGTRTDHVAGSETVTRGADRTSTVTGTDRLTVETHRQVHAAHQHDLSGGDWVKLSSPAEVRAETGQSLLVMYPAETTLRVGGCVLEITPTHVQIVAGGSTLRLDAGGIHLAGPIIEAVASGEHVIRGSVVKINS